MTTQHLHRLFRLDERNYGPQLADLARAELAELERRLAIATDTLKQLKTAGLFSAMDALARMEQNNEVNYE